MKKSFFLTASAIILFSFSATAQLSLAKTWLNQEKDGKIRVFLGTDGKYHGQIVWLKEPDENGKPKLDKENPDPEKRKKPVLNLQILHGLEKKSETEYVNGKIYDPKNGKTYDCKMTIINDKRVDLRGFVLGMPFLGRTSSWTLAED
jgi:uncharacterized protein (DUF2147 family)